MKFNSILILALSFFSWTQLSAQTELLEAVIIDKETSAAIPYATIIYPDQQYGFSANGNGYFRIRVGQSEKSKKVRISSIGYEQYNTTLGQMLEQKIDTIKLKPKVTILEEILVKAETEKPEEMIEQAAKSLKDFLGKDPYYLHVRYTESIKKNDQYAGFTEAIGLMHVSGYQAGYNRKNEIFAYDLAQWKHLRRTYYTLPSECNHDKKRTLGIDKLMKAKSRYLYEGPLHKSDIDEFKYTIDSLTSFNGNDVFIISFAPLGGEDVFRGQAYIKVDDYALIGLTVYETNANETLYDKCKITPTSEFNITFTKVADRYFINRVKLETTYNWNSTSVKETMVLNAEEFSKNEIVDLNYDQRMVVYNEMINPGIAYNDSFWHNEGNQLPEKLTEDLGQKEPLEKQFFSNSGKRPIPLPKEISNYEELYKNQDLFRLFVNDEF